MFYLKIIDHYKTNLWDKWFRQKMCTDIYLFTKGQNFRHNQIESICRQQNKCGSNTKIWFKNDKNIMGRGKNAGYQHFFLFPQSFKKFFFSQGC